MNQTAMIWIVNIDNVVYIARKGLIIRRRRLSKYQFALLEAYPKERVSVMIDPTQWKPEKISIK